MDQEDERYLVDLVKNLVKEYVRGEDCLNLLALPMTNDAANSSAARLVKEAGAQRRTIGQLEPDPHVFGTAGANVGRGTYQT